MKLLWLTNIPSPYRVDFFNELGRYCELTVLFEMAVSAERDESWSNYHFTGFCGIIIDGKIVDTDKAICLNVIKFLKKQYDHIIISNMATPTGIIAIEYLKMRKIPYLLEGDGGFKKNGKGLKEAYKKHLIHGAKAYFSTSASLDEYFLTYGASRENLYRYPFTSLWESDICSTLIDMDQKQAIKDELGIVSGMVVLTVGRFIFSKGYDVLLKACKGISEDTDIYLIGGKPTVNYLKLIAELNLNHIHFVEFQSKELLKKYYLAADLFVLPTRGDAWGLVINEAMANGLPVITTDKCVAGLELITNYENGFVIQADQENELAEKMQLLLHDHELRTKMALCNISKIKEYTIEAMVKKHLEVLEGILN